VKIKFINLFLILIAASSALFALGGNSADKIPTQPAGAPIPEARPSSPPGAPSTKTAVEEARPAVVMHNVPFTSQAPLGNWKDPRQQAGCEEAAALIAMGWVRGDTFTPSGAEKTIIAISEYELKNYGSYEDASAKDTVDWILKGYFNYSNVRLKYDIGVGDIKRELANGNVVIAPMNGQTIGNPYYTPPGPLRHMVVFIGYDDNKKEFITNDPGTSRGESFRYSYDRIQTSLQDYETGDHVPITSHRTAMIVVSK